MKKTEDKVKEELKAVEKEAEEVKEDVVYMGPDIPGVVTHSTVFKEGRFTEALNRKLKEIPLLQSVFVPLSKFVEATKELKETGSAFSIVYRKLEDEIRR